MFGNRSKKLIPKPKLVENFAGNCPVRQFTADGVNVGRCWHYIGDTQICPVHGDVSEAVKRLPKLTDEMDAIIKRPKK